MKRATEKSDDLSILVVVHNEEKILDECLRRLTFAKELVVVLDNCTDGSKEIAERYADRILEGSWELGSIANMTRKIFSRFFKCYVSRKGYKEDGYGVIIGILAAIYPLVSLLKARLEEERQAGL